MNTATITIRFEDDRIPGAIAEAAATAVLGIDGVFEADVTVNATRLTIDSTGAARNATDHVEHGIPANITARALRNIVPTLGDDAQDLGEWAYANGIELQDTAVLFRYLSGEAAADTHP